MNNETKKYKIKDKIKHTDKLVTLKMVLENNSVPKFIPGQFINVFFPETGIAEGKSYSISSSPQEKTINLTIKSMGKFSQKLCSLKVGDTISASLPYGYFFTEEKDTNLIMIAGGIGITPFMSMISNFVIPLVMPRPAKRGAAEVLNFVHLFWSTKNKEDLFCKEVFDQYSEKKPDFKVNYFVTEEKIKEIKIKNRRIELDDFKIYTKNSKNEFFICGSITFVRDFWNILKNAGVSDENIYTESFF